MRLLFDHNLSPRLVQRLGDLYPGASHVALVGLERADDTTVWQFARDHDHVIVTKDSDFNDLCIVNGFPPQVIWIQLGNCTTGEIEAAMRANAVAVEEFIHGPTNGVLQIT